MADTPSTSLLLPPQPATARARRTPLSYDSRSDRLVYPAGKVVVLRSVESPSKAQVFTGHSKPVTAVSVSPSGYHIASADPSGQVYVWGCDSDEFPAKDPFGAIQTPLDIAWDFESKRIIVVGDAPPSQAKFGVAITSDSGNSVGEISGHAAQINAVTIRPKRPFRAVTVDDDGKIAFSHGVPFKFNKSCPGHTNSVSDVKYSPDGSKFVTVGMDKKVGVWNGDDAEHIKWVETGHKGGILAVDWFDESTIITASTDKSVRITSIEGSAEPKVFQLPDLISNQQVGVVKTKSDIISLGLDGTLYYWSESSSEPVKTVYGHQKSVTAVGFDKHIYSASIEGNILKWTDGAAAPTKAHTAPVTNIELDDGLWSAGWDKKLIKLGGDTIELKEQPLFVAVNKGNYASISETLLQYNDKSIEVPRSQTVDLHDSLIAVGTGNAVVLYDTDLKQVHKFDPRNADVSLVRFSPDGSLLAAGDNSGKIFVYKLADKSVLTTRWAFHNTTVKSIQWHPNGKFAASGGADSSIYVYSVPRPARNLKFLDAHKDSVNAVAWADDGLVSGGADGVIKTWQCDLSKLE